MVPRNSFEAICELAARERWCWKLSCSTCGAITFRSGFNALIKGLHPDDSNWAVHEGDPVPQQLWDWRMSEAEQAVLSYFSAQADLSRIQRAAEFPNWLGYLGLVLVSTEAAEKATGTLTASWVPQLATLSRGTPDQLCEMFSFGRRLRWQDLELFEQSIRRLDSFASQGEQK